MTNRERIENFKEEFKKVFYVVDDTVLDVAIAVVVSTFVKCDAIWLLIIGPSSGGKSEIVNLFNKIDFTEPISELTENTLLSGLNNTGTETSLLNKLGSLGCLLMKDYTSILSMRREKQEVIMGQLREVYDGAYEKKTGNGKNPKWKGKMCFLGGVTEAVYNEDAESASMGRRNIYYVLPEQDRIQTTKRARENRRNLDIAERREHLQDLMKELVEDMVANLPNIMPPAPTEFEDKIIHLADFVTKVRTTNIRDFRGELKLGTSEEMPMRMSEQLNALASIMQYMYDGELTDNVQKTIIKIALDSIPKQKRMALRLLSQYNSTTTKSVALTLRYPTETVKEWLEDLHYLGVIYRIGSMGSVGTTDRWKIEEQYRSVVIEYDNIVRSNDDLILEESDMIRPYDNEVDPVAVLQMKKANRFFGDDIDTVVAEEQKEKANRLFEEL